MSAIELEPRQELFAASADVEACLYQCGGIGQLSKHFCLPSVSEEAAIELGLSLDINGQGIAGCGHVYLVVPPMGWGWSFWLAQRVHLEMLRRAAVPDDNVALGALPLPSLDPSPVELPCSDNINALGVKASMVTELRDRIAARFAYKGFSMHEVSGTRPQSTILGADFGGHPPVTRRSGQKLWILRGALQWLASGPIVTGRQVEVAAGHCVAAALVNRAGTSVPRALYDFVRDRYMRGRSPSHCMLQLNRRLAALTLATNIGPRFRWIPSEWQPADEASRMFEMVSRWFMLRPLSAAGVATSQRRAPLDPATPRGAARLPRASATRGLEDAATPSQRTERAPPLRARRAIAKRPAACRRPAASASCAAAPPRLRARLARALEPGRSGPASSEVLSRREQASAAAGTRVGYRDMEVRALQFLDLMLEAECTRADATILVAAVKDAYPWRTGSQSMPRVIQGLRGCTMRRPPARGHRDAALQVASTFFAYIRPGAFRKLTVPQLLPAGALEELTKTGASDETAILDHPAWLGECLAAHIRGKAPTDLIFPTHGGDRGGAVRHGGEAARAPPRVCLYQLRRGGTSDDILSGRRDHKTVKARGHWRTDPSLNRHGKPGAVEQFLITAVSREFGKQLFE
ncbi:unnamed protein product, partial [Prorocentrum cordatum]